MLTDTADDTAITSYCKPDVFGWLYSTSYNNIAGIAVITVITGADTTPDGRPDVPPQIHSDPDPSPKLSLRN